jgi:hypothetical protein
VIVVVVALVAGWLLKTIVESGTSEYRDASLALSYPAAWVREADSDAGVIFSASDTRSGSLYRTHVTIRSTDALPKLPLDAPGATIDKMTPAITAWSFGRGQELTAFRVLETGPATIGDREGAALHYAFVSEPIASPFRQALPVVVEAIDYLIPAGDSTIVLTVAADGAQFADANVRWFQPTLSSVRFLGE